MPWCTPAAVKLGFFPNFSQHLSIFCRIWSCIKLYSLLRWLYQCIYTDYLVYSSQNVDFSFFGHVDCFVIFASFFFSHAIFFQENCAATSASNNNKKKNRPCFATFFHFPLLLSLTISPLQHLTHYFASFPIQPRNDFLYNPKNCKTKYMHTHTHFRTFLNSLPKSSIRNTKIVSPER